jgi:hypothetical protein
MKGNLQVANVCPECGYPFQGNGFDGIDAHWRAKHEHLMPYREAWPLIKSGRYPRRTCSIDDFSGCLEQKGGPKLTIEEINEVTARGWAGESPR